jgi:hypothetical protein
MTDGPVLLNAPVRWWKCPSCGLEDRTQRNDVHTQFHSCPALGGVNIPLVEVPDLSAKVAARHVEVEREDYQGRSTAGPVAAIRTERADGSNDVTVFAPPATVQPEGHF